MNKMKLIFIGECIIIFCLLLVIGGLLVKEPGLAAEGSVFSEETSVLEAEGEPETVLNREEGPVLSEKIVPKAGELQKLPEQKISSNESSREDISPVTSKEVIERREKTQLVVFGDSIWNAGRGEDGISEQVMAEKDVIIYNCSIGGTTAAVVNESTQWDSWTSRSFNGMMYLVNDVISEEQLIPEETIYPIFKQIDFDEVDYILVSYGLNDYFSNVPIHPKEYFDLTSFVGALRHGIHKIQEKYPHIQFILTSPTYCGWFEGERDFGLGDYVEAARGVSQEYGTHFIDMYHALGKSPEQKMQYLEDGVHLTEEGRYLYARSVIDFLEANGIE